MNEKKKLGQGPAYPCDNNSEDTYIKKDDFGMTKYELIAKDAMCAIIASNNKEYLVNGTTDEGWHEPISIVKAALDFTDELLKQLEDGK